MSEITLEANRRELGRSAARAMRRKSIVPGIFYFHGEEPIAISVPELSLRPLIFTTESHLVRLRLDDGVEIPILDEIEARWSDAQRQQLAAALLILTPEERKWLSEMLHEGG